MTELNSFPLWVADSKFRLIFANRKMRSDLGISIEQLKAGVFFSDLTAGEVSPTVPEVGKVQASSMLVKQADGQFHSVLIYTRELKIRGKSYGYIGSMVRAGDSTRCLAPRPMHNVFSPVPRISIDICGVMADMYTAIASALGPLLEHNDPLKCEDLGVLRRELGELCDLNLAINVLEPIPQFILNVPAYDDVNFELLNEAHADGRIHTIAFSKTWHLTNGRVFSRKPNEIQMWLQNAGLQCVDFDSTSCNLIEKLVSNRVDAHVDDYPEEWIQALFIGIPAFLYDRPWNRWVKSDLRVYSMETVLEQSGVEPNTTLCDYDPEMMSETTAR